MRDVAPPGLAPGQLRIDVLACGICGSDLAWYRSARSPIVHWGHEVIGVVRDADQASDPALVGQTVVVKTTEPCGRCAACAGGHEAHCTGWTRHAFNGFAGSIALPETLVVPIAEPCPLVYALTEPLYVALDLADQSGVGAGQSAVIVGAGPIGLLTLYVLRQRGAGRVWIVVREHAHARRQLAARWGGDILGSEEFLRLAPGLGCDAAIVTAPYAAVGTAAPALRYGGRLVYNGISEKAVVTLDLRALHLKRISLIPSFPHPQTSFARALAMIRQDTAGLSTLISHQASLRAANDAFSLFTTDRHRVLKVLLVND